MTTLYKYLPPDRLTYLDDGLLRFTQPCDMNDPFECLPCVEDVDIEKFVDGVLARTKPQLEECVAGAKGWQKRIHQKAIKKAAKALKRDYGKNPDYLVKALLDKYTKRANETIGIFSLSRIWDNSLMWAHYTNSYKGFCVGFNYSHNFFKRQPADHPDVGVPVDVSYENQRVKIDINDSIHLAPKLLERKDEVWKYEEEVRLIRNLDFAALKNTRQDDRPICLFNVPHEAIQEIIVGSNASSKTVDKVLSFCHAKNISAFQLQVSLKNFGLTRIKLPKKAC